MAFKKAIRKAAPALLSISSVSGGGKTYSSLLLAAGLAGPNGRVGFIDTENGRGTFYADSPGIVAALPNGYEIDQLDSPFSPERYTEKILEAEKAGINVLVIDSVTHEWEGLGGCIDIAENNKLKGMPNWIKAKREHKKFMNHILSSSMDIIFCVRARDKVKIAKNSSGKEEFVSIGLTPIQEKNFIFEMLLSFQLDEGTHLSRALKCPERFVPLFGNPRLLTKADGEAIREWKSSGFALDEFEQVKKRARAAAEDGTVAYRAFFESITKDQRTGLQGDFHEEMKRIAEASDVEAAQIQEQEA